MKIINKYTVEEISIKYNYAEYQRRTKSNGDVEWWESYDSEYGGAFICMNDEDKHELEKLYNKLIITKNFV